MPSTADFVGNPTSFAANSYLGFINSGVTNKSIMDNVVLGGAARFWP